MATRRKTKRFVKLRLKHKRIREKKEKNAVKNNPSKFYDDPNREMRSISSTSIENNSNANNNKESSHVSIKISFLLWKNLHTIGKCDICHAQSRMLHEIRHYISSSHILQMGGKGPNTFFDYNRSYRFFFLSY